MRQNNAINILFLLLCVLLLGFVYLNTRMIESFNLNDTTEGMNVAAPTTNTDAAIEVELEQMNP